LCLFVATILEMGSFSYLVRILVLAAVAFSGCSPRSDDGRISHPLRISEGGLILVNVLVADSIECRFILDTGAGIHVVSHALLNRISSAPEGRFTGFRHTGERIDLDIHRIASLTIAGVRQDNPIVAVWSVLDSFKIDGILSLKFFEEHPFTLDLKDSILFFETSATLSAKAEQGRSVPIRVHSDRGRSLDVFADFRVSDSLKLECILDTGSPGTVVDARYIGALGIDTTSAAVRQRIRKSILGTPEAEYVTAVSAIALWDVPQTSVKQPRIVFKHGLIYDGLVGTDFMLGRKITFDISGRRLHVNVDVE